jgi:hypothetical protein
LTPAIRADWFATEDDEIDVDSLVISDLIDHSEGTGRVLYVIHSMPI